MKQLLLTAASALTLSATIMAAPIPGAPAPATGITFECTPPNLSGYLSFDMPKFTNNGESFMGNMDFTVTCNGDLLAEGRSYSGVNVSREITFPAKGQYTLEIVCTNNLGDGEPAIYTLGVGFSRPMTPQVSLTELDNNQVRVSWKPITQDVGGNVISDVKYTVIRLQGESETVVAKDITDTSFTDQIPASNRCKAYYYNVIATAYNTDSEPGKSSGVGVGTMIPPYTESFVTEDDYSLWLIQDTDGDANYWMYYYGEINLSGGHGDWAVSPPITVEAGKTYNVGFSARARSDAGPATVRLCWGNARTAAAMTNDLIGNTVISSESPQKYTARFTATADGDIYFGMQAVDAGYGVLVKDIFISEPLVLATPMAPADFTVTAGKYGTLEANISLSAPVKDLTGGDLTKISKIEVSRQFIPSDSYDKHPTTEFVTVKTFENPTPGAELSYLDNTIEDGGEYNYRAVGYTEDGMGEYAELRLFIGPNVPAQPKNVHAYELEENGVVRITWDPVTTYADGRELDPSTVKYCVWSYISGEDMKLLNEIYDTEVTFRAILEDEPQYMFYYMVTAENETGENLSDPGVSETVALGEPHDAPYEDSFPNLYAVYPYGAGQEEAFTYWDYASDKTFPGITTYDHDGGMMVMLGQEPGYEAYFFSGKINHKLLEKPALSFYLHNNAEDADNTIKVELNDRTGFKPAKEVRIGDLGAEGWQRVLIPLSDYEAKDFSFKITGKTVSSCRILLDNLQVVNRFDQDVQITSIDAPTLVKNGNNVDVTVNYRNNGIDAVKNFKLRLLADGTEIDSADKAELLSDAADSHTFTIYHTYDTPAKVKYAVEAVVESDGAMADNKSEEATVETFFPTYPTANDLVAVYEEGNPEDVTLSWSEPDMTAAIQDYVRDDFEDAADWATDNVGDWTFYDGDKGEIYGFGTWVTIPGIPNASQQSWWVMNGDYPEYYNHFYPDRMTTAHSGSKYLAQNAVLLDEKEIKCDDWAISPRLDGTAHTVYFWARGFFGDTDPETFEFLVSTGGTEITDFVRQRTVSTVGYNWRRYAMNVPEGTRHFAIRCISRDCFMLMIDDVDYIPEAYADELTLTGYNVYRDGIRLNDTPLTNREYKLRESDHNHFYHVSAVYEGRGESPKSNMSRPALASVGAINADTMRVNTVDGQIRVQGANGANVAVYGVDGSIIANFTANGDYRIDAAPGVYVVVCGNRSVKVIVK